jgi:hypothetical protein
LTHPLRIWAVSLPLISHMILTKWLHPSESHFLCEVWLSDAHFLFKQEPAKVLHPTPTASYLVLKSLLSMVPWIDMNLGVRQAYDQPWNTHFYLTVWAFCQAVDGRAHAVGRGVVLFAFPLSYAPWPSSPIYPHWFWAEMQSLRMKRQGRVRREYLQKSSDKGLFSKTHKELLKLSNKKTSDLIWKWKKGLNKYLSKENIHLKN